jgi:hypothetical protein
MSFGKEIPRYSDVEIDQIARMAAPRVEDGQERRPLRYGTLFGGIDIIRAAWAEHEHVFAVESTAVKGRPRTLAFRNVSTVSKRKMIPFQDLDVLVVTPPSRATDQQRRADSWPAVLLQEGPHAWDIRPKTIVLISTPADVLYRRGGPNRAVVKEFLANGYHVREAFLDATVCGAAVDQQRWVSLFTQEELGEAELPDLENVGARPMQNLLRPPGLVPKAY